ncbi:MAG TPA: MBL fold metallo-hydrolase [Actinomycetota bacterium]|jgi:glyoxylase-like metal-dependent hydrolase (beta-lactamase superfamily II)|nr:MBL fold metallo-hydrolase [Actinomycetota bacterium]
MVQTNVAGGIHRIEDRHTNYYLVESDGGVWIFDCGLPTSWDLFTHAMAQLHRRVTEVQGVVLTHGHYDHMGFAERARRTLAVPVYVHENDVPLTRHPLQYGRDKSPLAYLFRGRCRRWLRSHARERSGLPP